MNSRSASTAGAHKLGDCSFIASPNRRLPSLLPHITRSSVPAPTYLGEGDTHFVQLPGSSGSRDAAACRQARRIPPNSAARRRASRASVADGDQTDRLHHTVLHSSIVTRGLRAESKPLRRRLRANRYQNASCAITSADAAWLSADNLRGAMDTVSDEGFGPTDDDEWMHPIEAVQWLMRVDPIQYEDIAVAEAALDKWRRSGKLATLGLRAGECDPQSPPTALWQYYWVELHDASTRYVYRDPAHPTHVEFGIAGPWREIKYRRADVLLMAAGDCMRSDAHTDSLIPTAPSAPPKAAAKPERRGRKPKDFWPQVTGRAGAWLAANGTPDKQADLERIMADYIAELGRDAANSTVRRYARKLLAEFERELGSN